MNTNSDPMQGFLEQLLRDWESGPKAASGASAGKTAPVAPVGTIVSTPGIASVVRSLPELSDAVALSGLEEPAEAIVPAVSVEPASPAFVWTPDAPVTPISELAAAVTSLEPSEPAEPAAEPPRPLFQWKQAASVAPEAVSAPAKPASQWKPTAPVAPSAAQSSEAPPENFKPAFVWKSAAPPEASAESNRNETPIVEAAVAAPAKPVFQWRPNVPAAPEIPETSELAEQSAPDSQSAKSSFHWPAPSPAQSTVAPVAPAEPTAPGLWKPAAPPAARAGQPAAPPALIDFAAALSALKASRSTQPAVVAPAADHQAPLVQETAAAIEAPVSIEEVEAVDELAAVEDFIEASADLEENAAFETAAVVEEPEVVEEFAATETAAIVEEPEVVEEFVAIETAAIVEEPEVVEEFVAIEMAAIVEEPEVVEEFAAFEMAATVEEPEVVEEFAAIETATEIEDAAVTAEDDSTGTATYDASGEAFDDDAALLESLLFQQTGDFGGREFEAATLPDYPNELPQQDEQPELIELSVEPQPEEPEPAPPAVSAWAPLVEEPASRSGEFSSLAFGREPLQDDEEFERELSAPPPISRQDGQEMASVLSELETAIPAGQWDQSEAENKRVELQRHLVFAINHEKFAVSLEFLLEIDNMPNWTGIPGLPPSVRGLINRRGEIVSLLELRAILGLAYPELPKKGKIFVATGTERQSISAFAVDEIEGIIGFDPKRMTPIQELNPGAASAKGVTATIEEGESLIRILDIAGILADVEKTFSLDQAWM